MMVDCNVFQLMKLLILMYVILLLTKPPVLFLTSISNEYQYIDSNASNRHREHLATCGAGTREVGPQHQQQRTTNNQQAATTTTTTGPIMLYQYQAKIIPNPRNDIQ